MPYSQEHKQHEYSKFILTCRNSHVHTLIHAKIQQTHEDHMLINELDMKVLDPTLLCPPVYMPHV